MQITAYAVLGKDGTILTHALHGHLAIYPKKGDADTSTMIGKVVPVTINIIVEPVGQVKKDAVQ